MPFIGNQPALSYTSFAKQDFTTSATTSYVLDYPVTNANEIALFINFVRQEPTTAYTASGTSLTLTSATSASDDMYCVFLGKAVQTINPPSGSVGISQLSATGTKNATTFLRGDNTFASAGGNNTPAFYAKMSGTQTVNHNANVKVQFDTEVFDTDGCYDHSTNYRFTPTTAGKYLVTVNLFLDGQGQGNLRVYAPIIYKNGSNYAQAGDDKATGYQNNGTETVTAIVDMNGSSDYLEVYVYHFTQDSSTSPVGGSGTANAMFTAHKLIT